MHQSAFQILLKQLWKQIMELSLILGKRYVNISQVFQKSDLKFNVVGLPHTPDLGKEIYGIWNAHSGTVSLNNSRLPLITSNSHWMERTFNPIYTAKPCFLHVSHLEQMGSPPGSLQKKCRTKLWFLKWQPWYLSIKKSGSQAAKERTLLLLAKPMISTI